MPERSNCQPLLPARYAPLIKTEANLAPSARRSGSKEPTAMCRNAQTANHFYQLARLSQLTMVMLKRNYGILGIQGIGFPTMQHPLPFPQVNPTHFTLDSRRPRLEEQLSVSEAREAIPLSQASKLPRSPRRSGLSTSIPPARRARRSKYPSWLSRTPFYLGDFNSRGLFNRQLPSARLCNRLPSSRAPGNPSHVFRPAQVLQT